MSSSTAAAGGARSRAGRRQPGPTPAGEGRRAQRRAKRATERLRNTVRRLAGCLTALPETERRVLVLRSGIGPRRALSRATTADRLDLATRRVVRIERRGLRRLRSSAEGGGCGDTTVETIEIALGAAGVTGGGSPLVSRVATTTGTAGDAGATSGDSGGTGGGAGGSDGEERSDVKAEFDASGGDQSAVAVPPLGADQGGGGIFSIAALLLGLGMLGYALRRELRAGGASPG